MRIAFDAKRYFQNQTGLGNYSRWLIKGLQEHAKSHELFLCHAHEEVADLPVIGPQSSLGRRLPSLWRSRGINRVLRSKHIDLYHGLSNEIPMGIQHTFIPTVVTIHDLIFKRYPENYGNVDVWIYNRKVQMAQRYADRIVVPSEATKQDLMRMYATPEDRITVIPLGLPKLPELPSKPPIEGTYILCVSSFSERKNLIRLIKAFQESLIHDTKLVIAGAKAERYSAALRLTEDDPNVVLMTDLSSEDIHALYAHAQFCVYPSYFEGFGIPIQEAMMHGKVVACSGNSSLPEVAGKAALYFDPEDMGSIRSSLEELHFSERLRISLAEHIPAELERFENPRIIQAYIDLYEDVLDSHAQQDSPRS